MSARRSLKPSAPVAIGAAGGSPLGVLVVYALQLAGVDVPAEVAAAIGSAVGALLGYFVKGGRRAALA